VSPRQQFQENKTTARQWLEVADSAVFRSAKDAALLHFTVTQTQPIDLPTAAANEWRRQGAVAVLQILETLSVPNEQKQHTIPGQLNPA
jgi:hypothetical protein